MKSNFFRYLLVAGFLLMGTFSSFSQEYKSFEIRYQDNLRGDLTFIANNIVNRQEKGHSERVWVQTGNYFWIGHFEDVWVPPISPNDPYNATGSSSEYNDNLNMRYIDVDNDNSTFSSSSAILTYPSPECNRIRYAGLYWSATYPSELANESIGTNRQADFNQVKLKVPGGNYVDITGEVLYDGFTSTETAMRENSPYACYADVTSLLTVLPNPQGEYTIANVRSAQGELAGGVSAGWTLVIVYENPTLSGKLITTFDGFARVRKENPSVDINYSGFRTVPDGPVNARIGVAALEGDNRIDGDYLQIKAARSSNFSTISNDTNPPNNFFNSNITLNGAVTTNRNPNSINTLGYDTDIFELINANNAIINNGETEATFRFRTYNGNERGRNSDQYYPFFNSFNIEIIEPDIVLEKKVYNIKGDDITGLGVSLGETLDYVLKFKNVGNDDATQYTIRDVLPRNTTFISADFSDAPGVTASPVDANNQIIFTIPDNLVNIDDPAYTIRMRVKVAENCFDIVDACSDLIKNEAFSTYSGVSNDYQKTDDPSVTDFDPVCGFTTPGATNFLLDDLSACNTAKNVELCGASVILTAGIGFEEYIWYRDVNNDGKIDAGDTLIPGGANQLTVTNVGTYIVDKKVADPCKDFTEIFEVTYFGTTNTNPIVDWFNNSNNDTDQTNDVQGEILTCSIDGSLLPEIFLCGANDTQSIQINISDTESMVWEQLVEGSCDDAGPACGNKNAMCRWNPVPVSMGNGNSFNASTAGEFRLVVNYQDGCFNRFYFKVTQNKLDFETDFDHIICTTPGNISISNLGADYGYQLYDVESKTIIVPYSANNGPVFDINRSGIYRVGIMQLDNGVPIDGSCEFTTEDIGIRKREMDVNIFTQEANFNCKIKGSINIQVSDVRPNYTYKVWSDDGSYDSNITAEPENNVLFSGLNPGDYTVEVTTGDGCVFTDNITVGEVPKLELSALVTANIGCSDGEITLTATGGKPVPGYSYAIWSSKDGTSLYTEVTDIPADQYKTDGNTFSFAAGEEGTYVFVVVDGNNCPAFSNPVTIRNNGVLAATVTAADVLCSGEGNGEIKIEATGGVGPYFYSKDGGVSFVSLTPDTDGNVSFVGLAPGTYEIVVTDTSGCEVTDTVTIEQPFPLSASAGVSRDASCDPDNGAEVRVTNVVGGTGTYTYSFDGGSTYGTDPTALLHPGTYTVIVKDARGCTFEMPVTVADIPLPPNVTLTPEVSYDCVGKGIITVATDNPDYDYTYMINGVLNAPDPSSNVFTNVAPGTYTIRTIYKSQTLPTPSLLLREDFGFGGTIPSPNTTGYAFEDQTMDRPGNPRNINDGEYAVTSKIEAPFGTWANPIDHTTGTRDSQGRYLVINIGSPGPGQIIYSKTIHDIIHDQPLQVSLWMLNLMKTGTVGEDVDLTIEVREVGTGVVVASARTGIIPKNNGDSDWTNPIIELNPGANSSLEFVIRTEISWDNGNDVAIDDIEVYQIPEVCERIVEMPVIVEPNKMFEADITGRVHASCNGGSDGSITFAVSNFDPVAGFEYSLDGGTNWTTSTSSPVTLPTNLGAGTHIINIRKPNDTTPECNLELTETLTEPTEVKVSAEITGAFTCDPGITGATITAEASGGTPGYEYQLEDEAGGIIRVYQTTATFENVPAGRYVVRAKDTNDCSEAISTVQTVVAPEVLTFDATPIACYPGGNQGEIVVDVTAGNGNYSFFIDKGNGFEGPFLPDPITATTYTFNNLGPDDYTIEVRDQYSCSETSQIVTIAPELEVTASAPAITACANSTDVTITAIGGDGKYVYAVVPEGTAPADSDFSTTNPVAIGEGEYDVYVRDNDGLEGFCSDVFPITIVKNDPITITPTIVDVSCFGGSDGSISLSVNGGNAPYTYSIDNGATFETLGSFPNLSAGTYNVVVKDADGCTETVDVEVTQPDPITAEAVLTTDYTCLPNGEAVITVGSITPTAGGSRNYEYSINGGSWTTSTVFSGLTDGTHTVRVRDANAVTCLITLPAIIIDPLPVAPTLSSAVEYNCDGTGNVTITPFDADYTYTLGGLEQTGATPNVFTDLAPGNHTIVVDYGSACTTEITVNVQPGKEFTATISNPVNISCFDGDDGSFVINAANFGPGGF
ncbi:MAG TPA: hypothetical protein VLZ54_13485, partial [Arenibacter sp.]|nr:hypothetical protein [Arenibacter sp.]